MLPEVWVKKKFSVKMKCEEISHYIFSHCCSYYGSVF